MNAIRIDEIGRLVGDPSRAAILDALMDGRAWTGRELARSVPVTPPTASEHLQRLVAGGLVTVHPQGRHRYYRIASPEIASALESLMVLAERTTKPERRVRIAPELRAARTCYDHLAGEFGVALADALIRGGAIALDDATATVTPAGRQLFASIGLEFEAARAQRGDHAGTPCLGGLQQRQAVAGQRLVLIEVFRQFLEFVGHVLVADHAQLNFAAARECRRARKHRPCHC